MAMNTAPAAVATLLLGVGCSGQTLDVGHDAPPPAPEYAGPVSPGVDGGTEITGPTPVATHQFSAHAVAVDDRRVYWSADVIGPPWEAVRSCDKSDCAASVITYANLPAGGVAVNQDRIFANAGGVFACPLDGCVGAPAAVTANQPFDFVVDDQSVYFVSFPDATLVSCPVDGCPGGPTVLAFIGAGGPGFLGGYSRLAADAMNLYWSECATADSGIIKTIPKHGSAPARTIATGLHLPGALAVGADRVYWAENYSSGTIRSCPIAGCAGEPTTLATEQPYPNGLAVDQAHAYWFTTADPNGNGPGQILECPLSGCGSSPTVLATDQPSPTDLAIDSSFVFWSNAGPAVHATSPVPVSVYNDGSVYRAPIAWP